MDTTVVNIQKILFSFLLLIGVLSSCQEKKFHVSVSLDSFADMANSTYKIDAEKLSENINRVVMADSDRETADIHARRHYLN